jgi:hypothetical protein
VEFLADDSIPFDKLKMHVIVNVWRKDGTQLSERVDKLLGWQNPLTREQRLHKFFGCTRRVLSEKGANRVLELVEGLENLSDVREIMDIIRGDPR